MDINDFSVGMGIRTNRNKEGIILHIQDGMLLIKWRHNNLSLWYGPDHFEFLHIVFPDIMPEPLFTLEEINAQGWTQGHPG